MIRLLKAAGICLVYCRLAEDGSRLIALWTYCRHTQPESVRFAWGDGHLELRIPEFDEAAPRFVEYEVISYERPTAI